MPRAYLIVHGIIRDPERWRPAQRVLDRLAGVYGARILARTGEVDVVEGTFAGARVAIFEFPSLQALQLLVESPDYADINAIRKGAGEVTLWAVAGGPDAPDGPAEGDQPPAPPPSSARPPSSETPSCPARAYLIARTEFREREQCSRFHKDLSRLGAAFGARSLARTDQVEAIRGTYPGGWFSLIEAPSLEALRTLLASAECTALLRGRQSSAVLEIWAMPGL